MKNIIRLFSAVSIISIGIILVLFNLGVIAFDVYEIWVYLYPIFFVLVGIKWIIQDFRKKGKSWEVGSFFLLFGLLLLLDRLAILSFHFFDVWKLWPLFIVYIGVYFLKRDKNYSDTHWNNIEQEDNSATFSKFSIGTYEYTKPNWRAEPTKLHALFGDFYLDFSKAFIPEHEIPFSIRSLAGDVTILIPEHVPFRVQAVVRAGEIEIVGKRVDGVHRKLSFQSDNYEHAIRKIDFIIKLEAGSIRIEQV
ncbi:cell wall-active antibiotics response protein LiaF [Virgibacillus dokdonensis]|uniref:Cell wall-active antibiotics response protein LiaF n=1 Tax=Virgibacillus dokdonensis TaxID=302167 RepID=A0ABU7VH93_9BACI